MGSIDLVHPTGTLFDIYSDTQGHLLGQCASRQKKTGGGTDPKGVRGRTVLISLVNTLVVILLLITPCITNNCLVCNYFASAQTANAPP